MSGFGQKAWGWRGVPKRMGWGELKVLDMFFEFIVVNIPRKYQEKPRCVCLNMCSSLNVNSTSIKKGDIIYSGMILCNIDFMHVICH